jgi:tripartite-type tricarboxylate transporter receptor subunit TctC
MMMTRVAQAPLRRRGIFAGGAALLASPAVLAQSRSFPTQPIKIIVGFPAGGTFDSLLRVVGAELRELLGQNVVLETRSGAGGAVAFTAVKSAPADGYTLGGLSTAVVSSALLENVPYDPLKDFTYISSLVEIPFAAAVPAESPIKSWADLMAFGRAHPEQVFYGSASGLAQTPHLLISEVATRENLPWTVVPFRGSADCMVALLGGQLTFAMDTMVSVLPFVRSGRVRLLAIASDRRTRSLPEVPTLADLGYTTLIRSFYGVGGPAGMAPEVVNTLQEALRIAVHKPSVLHMLQEADQEPRYLDAAQMTDLVSSSMRTQGELIARYGLGRRPPR